MDLVACFHFLYFGLNLGRNILPLEMCMFYTGTHFSKLPLELNADIGQYVYGNPIGTFLQNHEVAVLQQFAARSKKVFDHCLEKLFDDLCLLFPEPQHFLMSSLNEEIQKLKNRECDYDSPLYTIKIVVIFVLEHFSGEDTVFGNPASLLRMFTNDKTVMSVAVKKHDYLNYASDALKDDEELVLLSMKQYHAISFSDASERIRDIREIALLAVQECFFNFTYISERLRDDETIATIAVDGGGGYIFDYASSRLKNDIRFVEQHLKNSFDIYYYLSEAFKDNEHLLLIALKINPTIIESTSLRLMYEPSMAIAALQGSPETLSFLIQEFRDNEVIVTVAIKQSGLALRHASCRLQDTESIVALAIAENPDAIQHASKRLQKKMNAYQSLK